MGRIHKMSKKQENRRGKPCFKPRWTTLLIGVMVLVALIPLIIALFEEPKASDVLGEVGISGMKVNQFKINNVDINKLDHKENNFDFKTIFYEKGRGIKQDILIKNKIGSRTAYDFSMIIEIDYSRIIWHGKEYKLTSAPLKLFSWHEGGRLIAPSIFMGAENKVINYKDIAEKGGYGLAYEKDGKYFIELKIPSLSIGAYEEIYIDPTFTNATDGFHVSSAGGVGADNPVGIGTNGTDMFIADADDGVIYRTSMTGTNRTGSFTVAAVGIGDIRGIEVNDTDVWALDATDLALYHMTMSGSNLTGGFPIGGIGAASAWRLETNGTDFWFADNGDKFIYHTTYDGTNQTDGFSIPGASSGMGVALRDDGDFWVLNLDFIAHYNSFGDNQTDGFDISGFGMGLAYDMTTDGVDLFMLDNVNKFVFHLEVNLILNSPADEHETIQNELTFNCTGEKRKIHNISLFHNISGTFELNQTLDVSATEPSKQEAIFDVSQIPLGTHKWSCRMAIDTGEVFWAVHNRTFTIRTWDENSQTYNTSAYETATETFEINVTYDSSCYSLISADLNYNGTSYTGTKTGIEDEVIFSSSLDIQKQT